MSYAVRLHQRVQSLGTSALVGIDPRYQQLPENIQTTAEAAGGSEAEIQARAFEVFSCGIIDVVASKVPAVKPQVAFFEQLGPAGLTALQKVIRYAREKDLIVIADAKRGDIGSTATAYAHAWLAGEDPDAAPFAADALTVSPYLGDDTLNPFVELANQRKAGLYVLVRTSNPGATAFQDRSQDNTTLFETVADTVQNLNASVKGSDDYGCVGAVVGATWPKELVELRQRMPNTPLLVPGYGSQGGTAADVAAAMDAKGNGALINSSRAINFAWTREEFAHIGQNRWQDAVSAATDTMIEDLRLAASEAR